MSEEEQTPATDPPAEEEAAAKTEEATEGESKGEASTADAEGRYTPLLSFKYILIVFYYLCLSIVSIKC